MTIRRGSLVFFASLALSALTPLLSAAEPGEALWGPAGGLSAFGQTSAPRTDAVEYQVRKTPASRAQDPDVLDNRVRATFIVSQSTAATWSVSQTAGAFRLSRSPVIPQTGLVIPRTLWDVDTGASYQHRLAERRSWGVSASVGSASDELYHGISEMTLRVTGNYQIPSRDKNSWLFLLSYSNDRHFANGVPLPGVAYLLRAPEHGLDALIGLPFIAINYRPAPLWRGCPGSS